MENMTEVPSGGRYRSCGPCTDGGIVRGPDMGRLEWVDGLLSSGNAWVGSWFAILNWAGP